MALVKGGTFEMGVVIGEDERDSALTHPVTLNDYYIGRNTVTFDEYDAFCINIGKEKPFDAGWGRGRRPVISVSWYDAVEYCNWLTEKTGLAKVYTITGEKVTADWSADGFRLPTEAEWQFAARERGRIAGFSDGKDIVDPKFDDRKGNKKSYSVMAGHSEKSVSIGSQNSSNALGLYHMFGSKREWCWDIFIDYLSTIETAPSEIDVGLKRVVCGGAWTRVSAGGQPTLRNSYLPSLRLIHLGFRLAKSVKQQA